MADSGQEYGTVIGPDATFKGDFTFDSAAKLLGKLEGSIESKGRIYIANGSTCKATITAKEVAVEGHVEGNVEAGDLLEIKPKGAITGDITATRMTMGDGASINGHCRIGVNGTTGSRANSQTEVKPSAAESSSSSAAKATAKAR